MDEQQFKQLSNKIDTIIKLLALNARAKVHEQRF
jgi:hypothetical protein